MYDTYKQYTTCLYPLATLAELSTLPPALREGYYWSKAAESPIALDKVCNVSARGRNFEARLVFCGVKENKSARMDDDGAFCIFGALTPSLSVPPVFWFGFG